MIEKMGRFNGATFLIEIKNNENQSWQGKLTWVEEKKECCFRSALELIKIMDSAVCDHEEN